MTFKKYGRIEFGKLSAMPKESLIPSKMLRDESVDVSFDHFVH